MKRSKSIPQAHDHRFINEQGHARARERWRDTHSQTAPQAGRNALTGLPAQRQSGCAIGVHTSDGELIAFGADEQRVAIRFEHGFFKRRQADVRARAAEFRVGLTAGGDAKKVQVRSEFATKFGLRRSNLFVATEGDLGAAVGKREQLKSARD